MQAILVMLILSLIVPMFLGIIALAAWAIGKITGATNNKQ